jgi:hypothetical protein
MQKYIKNMREAREDKGLLLITPETMAMTNKIKSPIFQGLRIILYLLVNTPTMAYMPGIKAVYGDSTSNINAINIIYSSLTAY